MMPDKLLIGMDKQGNQAIIFYNPELLRRAQVDLQRGIPITFAEGITEDITYKIIEGETSKKTI